MLKGIGRTANREGKVVTRTSTTELEPYHQRKAMPSMAVQALGLKKMSENLMRAPKKTKRVVAVLAIKSEEAAKMRQSFVSSRPSRARLSWSVWLMSSSRGVFLYIKRLYFANVCVV